MQELSIAMRQTEDNRQWLVISDLDGTLLNHHDYQYQAALPAIDQLKSKQIPVILNTSKTYPETLKIQKLLGIEAPFIVENGSCLFLPQSQFPEKPDSNARQREHFWEIVLGNTLEQIDATLEKLAIENNAYLRLSKCSPAEVARLTGLTESQAKDAIAREFSEPVIWNKSGHELESFKQLLQQQNLKTLQGGRFLHILGACDKGTAID